MKYLYIVILSLTITSCLKKDRQEVKSNSNDSFIKYAKGFAIQEFDTHFILKINTPYQDSKTQYEYILAKENYDANTNSNNAEIIKIPISKVIATSTTHIPMIEALQEEKSLVGFPNTYYVSSTKTRKLIDEGFVKEVGMDANLNTEIIIDLNPDIIIGFSVDANNKSLEAMKRMGIDVIYNGAWLEEAPLGRAEWLKFFGVLYNKTALADSIFNEIEKSYITAKEIASKTASQPTILSGAMFKDIWNMPAGNSFVAQFFKDANTNYLWKDTKGAGSLQLNFENVLDIGQMAEIWIGPGSYISKEGLLNANPHYANFNSFKTGNVYTFSKKKGATGGTIYYELGALRPDLLLKDIIKISHPELLTNEAFTFFDKIE